MIFHDRITVTERTETGEFDDYGNPTYDDVEVELPAEVRPLFSSETVQAGGQVQSRYRVHMPGRAEASVQSKGFVRWRGKKYEVEGDVEAHMLGRRLHHIEFIAHRTTG